LPWFTAVAAIGAAILAYAPGLNGPFVFDDVTNIAYNPSIRVERLSVKSLYELATSVTSGPLQRPVSMVSLGLNYYFGQYNPIVYKTTNLAIHILTGVALFLLTWRLLHFLHARHSGKFHWSGYRITWLSLAICATWLLHPLNLTSVLYVVQRMASLAGMFTAFGLLGYAIGREQIVRGERRGIATIFASTIVFGALATLSKESGILLAPYIAVIELIIFRFHAAPSLQKRFRQIWIASATAMLFVALIVAILKMDDFLIGYWYRDYSMAERLLTEARALWFYLGQILIPDITELSVFHDDFVVSRGLLDPPTTVAAVIGLIALFAVLVLAYRRHAWLTFGLAWFFAGHSLESTILPLLLAQEHRNYIAQYGIIAASIYYVSYPYSALNRSLPVRYALIVIFVTLLGINTHARATHWKDEWTLYNVEVRNHPNSINAHTMLGVLFHDNGYDLQAEHHLTQAANLSTYQSDPLVRLIQQRFVVTKKVPPEMLDELEQRMSTRPFNEVTLWVFEPLFLTVRSDSILHRRVCEIYEQAINRPDARLSAEAREISSRLLGANYGALGDYRKALTYFERAMQFRPAPQYYLASADIHARLGEKRQARELLEQLRDAKIPLTAEQEQELVRLEKIVGMKTS
jgi:tetratricopeptide (TPR) repeat protein